MSVKAYEPSIQICLVHDDNAIKHLTEKEKALFDILTLADESDYTVLGKKQYQRMKLCAYKYSPFQNSLYIDVDTMWFPKKKISDLIAHLMDHDFYIGKNGEYDPATKKRTNGNYTWWGEIHRIVKYFRLKNIVPQTISGVFWFKKGALSEKIFARALEVYNDPKAPTQKWANGKADEYCFNVALSDCNYQQKNIHFVYFDKTNGVMARDTMFSNYWGMAAGGNRLSAALRDLYNELVDLYHEGGFQLDVKRKHVDKIAVIRERRNF